MDGQSKHSVMLFLYLKPCNYINEDMNFSLDISQIFYVKEKSLRFYHWVLACKTREIPISGIRAKIVILITTL